MNWRARVLTAEQLDALREHPDEAARLATFTTKEPGTLTLHNLWHGLNWLLIRAEDPILGGRDIGPSIGPTGPARLLLPDTVAATWAALEVATADDIRAAYDQDAMLDESVYPPIWGDADVLEGRLVPAFEKLRTFYRKAAGSGVAVLTAIMT